LRGQTLSQIFAKHVTQPTSNFKSFTVYCTLMA